MPDLAILVLVVAVVTVVGVRLGMVLIAPRISRALDRAEHDEDPGDRPD